MKITYYGHACFSVQINDKHLLFDPFVSYNELAKHISIKNIKADYIFVSHGHQDHIADLLTIAQQNEAMIVSSWEVISWVNQNGYAKTHPMNTGGSWNFDDFSIKCVVAQHSSSMPDGSYGGNPMGFLVSSNEGDFYYAGDTALTMDMQLIPFWTNNLKFALLPIGNNFTMDYKDAIIASDFIKCNNIIGLHYDTFGYIKIDKALATEAFAAKNKNLTLISIGDTISI